MPPPSFGLLAVLWLAVAAVTGLALAGLAGLRYDDGLHGAFASDSPRYDDYRHASGQFTPSDGDAVILFRSLDFADPGDLRRVADFVAEARLVDAVADALSIFALRSPPGKDDPGRPLIPTELPARAELARLIDNLGEHSADGARLISRDRGLTAVVVALDEPERDLDIIRAALDELAALAADAVEGSGMSFAMTGVPVIRVAVLDGLYGDLLILNLVGIAAGIVVCVAALRSISLAVLTGIPSVVALLWAIGAISALGYEIDVLSVAVPVLILVLSIADSLHLTFEARRLRQGGMPLHRAAMKALLRVGPACALASVTTAIAFGGLTLSRSALIGDLGVAGCVATMVSLLAVLVLHPLLFVTASCFPRLETLAMSDRRPLLSIFDWRGLPAAALARPRAVTAATFAALVLAAGAYSTVEPVYSLMENLDRASPAAHALEEMNRELAPIDTIDIPVRMAADGRNGIDAASLIRVEAVVQAVAETGGGAAVVSLAALAAALEGESREDRAARLSALAGRMSDNQRGRLLSADGETALVRLHTPDRGSVETRDLVRRLEAALAGTDALRPTGFLVVSSFIAADMISDLNRSFLAAVAVSGLLIVLWFRNLRYGLVAMVPNVRPIMLVGGWLALSGRGLQFSSGIALTIAFGIALDDTVHILNRLKLNAQPDAPFDPAAIRLSMEEITPVLVITTAVLSFGLVGTFFSSMPTTAYFGALCVAVFFLAILADLVVLPASLVLLDRKRRLRGVERPA